MRPVFRSKKEQSFTRIDMQRCIELIQKRGWVHVDSALCAEQLITFAKQQGHFLEYQHQPHVAGSPHLVGDGSLFK